MVPQRFSIIQSGNLADTILAKLYVKIRSSIQPVMSRKSERDRTDYALAQFSKYSVSEITRLDYTKSLGYHFLARTDM
jgi:hypothetical protein